MNQEFSSPIKFYELIQSDSYDPTTKNMILLEQIEWLVKERFQNDMDWYHLKKFIFDRLQEDDYDEKMQTFQNRRITWQEVPFQTLVQHYCDYLMAAPQEAHVFDEYISRLLSK